MYSERERELEEQLWEAEDTLNTIQPHNYNAEGVGSYLRDFVSSFTDLDNGERKLLVESLVKKVEIGSNKTAAVMLQPPFGFLSPTLALRGEKPKMEFTICLEYSLMNYYGGTAGRSRVFTQYSKQEYSI
jgi:hypothetical protein